MKIRRCLSCFLFLVSCAMAQTPGDVRGAAEPPLPRESRRSELRQALLPQRQPAQAAPNRVPLRQLSPLERQALRQQLRQQQPQGAVRTGP